MKQIRSPIEIDPLIYEAWRIEVAWNQYEVSLLSSRNIFVMTLAPLFTGVAEATLSSNFSTPSKVQDRHLGEGIFHMRKTTIFILYMIHVS